MDKVETTQNGFQAKSSDVPNYVDFSGDEAHVRVEFKCEKQNGTIISHIADCATELKIQALKDDLKGIFDCKENQTQMWTLRSKILEDDKQLCFYGITGNETNIIILVKCH